jgi:hypothetical protein
MTRGIPPIGPFRHRRLMLLLDGMDDLAHIPATGHADRWLRRCVAREFAHVGARTVDIDVINNTDVRSKRSCRRSRRFRGSFARTTACPQPSRGRRRTRRAPPSARRCPADSFEGRTASLAARAAVWPARVRGATPGTLAPTIRRFPAACRSLPEQRFGPRPSAPFDRVSSLGDGVSADVSVLVVERDRREHRLEAPTPAPTDPLRCRRSVARPTTTELPPNTREQGFSQSAGVGVDITCSWIARTPKQGKQRAFLRPQVDDTGALQLAAPSRGHGLVTPRMGQQDRASLPSHEDSWQLVPASPQRGDSVGRQRLLLERWLSSAGGERAYTTGRPQPGQAAPGRSTQFRRPGRNWAMR